MPVLGWKVEHVSISAEGCTRTRLWEGKSRVQAEGFAASAFAERVESLRSARTASPSAYPPGNIQCEEEHLNFMNKWHCIIGEQEMFKIVVMRKLKLPSQRTLEKYSFDGISRCPDGCKVEPDGTCIHGDRSWLLIAGVI